MRRSLSWVAAGIIGLVVIGYGTPAAAQDAPAELSGGYNFFTGKSSGDDAWENFPAGWYADVAGNVTKTFGIVGQFTGNYKTITESDGSFDLNVHSYLFGVRGSSRRNARVVPFAQFLVGGAHLSGSQGSFSASESDLALQFGGGVNFFTSKKIGARAGLDYQRIFGKDGGEISDGEAINVVRFSVGVVIPLGGR